MTSLITSNMKDNRGIIILLSMFFLGAILAISFALSVIFTPKIRSSFDVKSSPGALYAADSGAEWCLFVVRKGSSISALTFANGAQISINDKTSPMPSDCVSPVRSVGTYREITRALEVSF